MKILGIWDGHDSGVAVVEDGELVFAINEERLTRRKLEIQFPHNSIALALQYLSLTPSSIDRIAFSTTDPAKTLTRYLPTLKERYYQIRRRKVPPSRSASLARAFKFQLTLLGPNSFTRSLSERYMRRELAKHGLQDTPLTAVQHHAAHAAGAALSSGYDSATVVTLDGLGDGASGSIWKLEGDRLIQVIEVPSRDSLGIFFEMVTQLLNMRELEDEGKVMALASYSQPQPFSENPFNSLFSVENGSIRCALAPAKLFRRLSEQFWCTPFEQFAFFAQQTVEEISLRFIAEAVKSIGIPDVALAGGVAANVRVNQRIRELPQIHSLYVFPHMGDGGLAAGAALALSHGAGELQAPRRPLSHTKLGPAYPVSEIHTAVHSVPGVATHELTRWLSEVAELLARGEIVLWFSGRMEFGPRALGGRSILARPDSTAIRDRLNYSLKKRSWFQPFCPTMTAEYAEVALEGFNRQSEPFMTNAYTVKLEHREQLRGVIHVDGTCRPQILETPRPSELVSYTLLLQRFSELTGIGALLNTSFNRHGEPLVCSPQDALRVFQESGFRYLVLEDTLVTKS